MSIRNSLQGHTGKLKAAIVSLVVLALILLVYKLFWYSVLSFIAALVLAFLMPKTDSGKTPRQKVMFGAINSPEQARTIVRQVTTTFYALLGLQLVVSAYLAWSGTNSMWFTAIGALVLLFIVYAIRNRNSRTATVILGILLLLSLIAGFIGAITQGNGGYMIAINLLLLWFVARAEKAVSYLSNTQTHGAV